VRKRMLVACIALVCVQLFIHSSPASGIARFAIRGESGDWLCNYWPGPGELFEVFVFVYTDDEGVYCAEYKLLAPDNWTHVGTVGSPEISTQEGNPAGAPGVTVCFTQCQTAAFWMYKLIYTHVDGHCSLPETVAHDDTGGHLVRICLEPDYPESDAYGEWNVGPNCLCPAVEETSWGAIKGMYR
jgi:hypothetical protein